MKGRKKILDAIRELGKADRCELFQGTVDEVNQSTLEMKVDINDGLLIPGVRLRSIISDDKGMWVIPKVGSTVIIGLIEGGTEFVLISAEEIDKIFIKIASKTFQMDTNGAVFNGGNNNGIPKVTPVVTKFNNSENKINALITAIAGWVPVANDGGAALKAALTSWLSTQLTPTVVNDLANPDLKH